MEFATRAIVWVQGRRMEANTQVSINANKRQLKVSAKTRNNTLGFQTARKDAAAITWPAASLRGQR